MEVFQTVQWLAGDVYDNNLTGIVSCTSTNTSFTIIAHTLIWLQPILFSYIGYRTSKHKTPLVCLFWISWMVLFYSLYSLYVGLYQRDYYQINNSILGASTCTNSGPTGHLVWRFKPSIIEYFPNYLMYLVMCSLAFLLYDRHQTRIIGIGWVLALVITKIALKPALIEMASSWCLLSIIGNIIIVIDINYPL